MLEQLVRLLARQAAAEALCGVRGSEEATASTGEGAAAGAAEAAATGWTTANHENRKRKGEESDG